MDYQYKVEAGDWSNDGHNQSEVFYFKCSHSKTAIMNAYDQAVRRSGVALREGGYGVNTVPKGTVVVCSDYEDNVIRTAEVEKLKAIGVPFEEYKPDSDNFENDNAELPWEQCMEEDGYWATAQDLATLFLEMAKTQLEGFTYKFTNDEVENIFRGFGYGCFS